MGDRISTALSFALSLRSLQDQQAKLYTTQGQIATGKKVNSPKDDPIGSSRLLTLEQQQATTEQYQQSIDDAISSLSLEEVQLQSITQQLSTIKDLCIQANVGGKSRSDQEAIALQLEQIREQLLGIANTNLDGKYIFSGSKSFEQSVIKDATGAYVYNGDEVQLDAQIGSTLNITTSDTAKSIFFGFPTSDATIEGFTGRTRVTSTSAGLINVPPGSGAITAHSLKINGIEIAPSVTDGVSTTDATASSIAVANAINATTSLHGVVAEVNANVLDFTGGTYTSNAIAAGNFTINGVQIFGAPATADALGLANLINATNGGNGVPGVTASVNAGQLRLIATDGRNIQLQTDGNSAQLDFTNFHTINAGAALNQVQRGTISLCDHQPITIEGTLTGVGVGQLGINAGEYGITANAGTGVLGQPAIVAARPQGSSNNDKYLIKFLTPTTFNIYKESDPTTPLTQFRKFTAGQTIKNATTVPLVPVDYVAGDTVVVEGVQFTITGAPVANDTFTVALTQVDSQDVFGSINRAINALRNYSDNPERLSYEIGLALSNIDSAEDQVLGVTARLGARMNLADTQKECNDDFIFFTQQSASTIRDVDLTKAISDFVKYQLSYEATQKATLSLQKLSLFSLM